MTNPTPTQPPGDPPTPVDAGPGGTGEGADRGCGGMTPEAPPLSTLWDVAVREEGAQMEADDEVYWLSYLQHNKCMRAAMNLRAMDRLRKALDQCPASAGASDPVVLRAGDAVVLARMLLSRFS